MTAPMTFDGKKESFKLLEDLLLTMIQIKFVDGANERQSL